MKERNYRVEFCRFLACCIIMTHHAYVLGFSGEYPFERGWAWVDYFFMLTGFFTIMHFKKNPPAEGTCGRTAMKYTLNKFKGFMPLAVFCILGEYLVTVLYSKPESLGLALRGFINMPFEMLMLSSAFHFNPSLSPIWYLAAMFITLPVLCYAVTKWSEIWYILCLLVPLWFYGSYGVTSVRDWPLEPYRAFACMAFGTCCYYIAEWIKTKQFKVFGKAVLTVLELGSLILAVLLTERSSPELVFLVLLFPIQISIMMSNESFLSCVNAGPINKLFAFLGKMSLPMFIIHWLVATIVGKNMAAGYTSLIVYFGSTMILAAFYVMMKGLKKKR